MQYQNEQSRSENTLNLKQYTQAAARTCPAFGKVSQVIYGRDAVIDLDSMHMTMGMVTEVGELADVFKKNMAYGKPIDWVNVGEEVADVMWYLVNFCRMNNIDLESELHKNIEKLKVRFPEKFTGEQAINRNVAAERVELEK